MTAIALVDIVAVLFVIAGSQIAFNPGLMGRLSGRKPSTPVEVDRQADTASVLRMVGVMVMAFAFTLASLVTLIFVYSQP